MQMAKMLCIFTGRDGGGFSLKIYFLEYLEEFPLELGNQSALFVRLDLEISA